MEARHLSFHQGEADPKIRDLWLHGGRSFASVRDSESSGLKLEKGKLPHRRHLPMLKHAAKLRAFVFCAAMLENAIRTLLDPKRQ